MFGQFCANKSTLAAHVPRIFEASAIELDRHAPKASCMETTKEKPMAVTKRRRSRPYRLEPHYTIRQVGEALHLSDGGVHGLIREKRLRSVLVGRNRLIPASAVEEFLAKARKAKRRPTGFAAKGKRK